MPPRVGGFKRPITRQIIVDAAPDGRACGRAGLSIGGISWLADHGIPLRSGALRALGGASFSAGWNFGGGLGGCRKLSERLEARVRIELTNKGFADLCLTTWLPRLKGGDTNPLQGMERETGFEPATSTLARSHSTAELLPHARNFNLAWRRAGRKAGGPSTCLRGTAIHQEAGPRVPKPARPCRALTGCGWKPGYAEKVAEGGNKSGGETANPASQCVEPYSARPEAGFGR